MAADRSDARAEDMAPIESLHHRGRMGIRVGRLHRELRRGGRRQGEAHPDEHASVMKKQANELEGRARDVDPGAVIASLVTHGEPLAGTIGSRHHFLPVSTIIVTEAGVALS